MTRSVRIVDSHTEGEPTRVVIEGGPRLSGRTLAEKASDLGDRHDGFRRGVVLEPRGSDTVVGALLTEPSDSNADFGVIFFNNRGCLGMCGHGTIGVAATLRHLGRAAPGVVRFDTPAGLVRATIHEDGRVSVVNVRSFRHRKGIEVAGPFGRIAGDVAYGGNWFFLAPSPIPLAHSNLGRLVRLTSEVMDALADSGISGPDGARIDHVELFGPPERPDADSMNFVMCPGLAYDRSPCGTGTSAKVACLAAEGKLAAGQLWRQESFIGTLFEASYRETDGGILPEITGRAWITGEGKLLFQEDDPFRTGISWRQGS